MVRRVILGTLAGAAVYFVWEIAVWRWLPLHDWTIRKFADEPRARAFFQSATRGHAVYALPYIIGSYDVRDPKTILSASMRKESADSGASDTEPPKPDNDYLRERMREGPIVFVVCDPDGADPADWRPFVSGAILDLGAAFIAALVLAVGARRLTSYASRVLMVTALGLFVALVAHLPYWNWMSFPLDYCLMMGAKVTVGWCLAGLATGLIVEHRETVSQPQVAGA